MPYYIVVLGDRPGIYDTWDECELAIGDRNPPPPHPKPHWRRRETSEEAEEYFDEMSRAFKEMFQASNKFQNDLDEIRMQMSKQKKRSLEMDVQLRQNRTKVARLENLVKQTNPLLVELENALDKVRGLILKGNFFKSKNPFKLQLQELGHCSVRLHFKIGDETDKSEFQVDFGKDSPLNKTFSWFEGVKCTEYNGELQAALVALRIANEAGIKKLRIESQFSYIKISNKDGDLMRMLDAAVDALDDVQWVQCAKIPKEI